METFAWLLAGALAMLAADRLLLRAEAAGFIYYRKRKPNPGAVGSALAQVHGILEPEKVHVAEVMREQAVEADEQSGKPPPVPGAGNLIVKS